MAWVLTDFNVILQLSNQGGKCSHPKRLEEKWMELGFEKGSVPPFQTVIFTKMGRGYAAARGKYFILNAYTFQLMVYLHVELHGKKMSKFLTSIIVF